MPYPHGAIVDGRYGAHRCLAVAASILLGVAAAAGAQPAREDAPLIAIGRDGNAYTVTARFDVPHSAAVALNVLTDYEGIPRFVPDIKKSTVVHRHGPDAVVEQEAVSSVMMFSKRVHVRLSVQETSHSLRFRDELGTSFTRYEGHWQLTEYPGHTVVAYQLVADPSFGVPGFLIRRLLTRDATEMIGRLRVEMAARATAR